MPTSFKDLEFSIFQHFIVIRVKYFGISRDSVRTNNNYHFLVQHNLVDYSPKDHTRYSLSDKGKMYLRYKRRNRLRFWIPVIISIIALFGGYGVYTNPLIEKLLQETVKLVKTITESLDALN